MNTFTFKINTREILADVLTPVAVYLKLRDVYPQACLLEGADFKAGENQYSFIALEPLAGFRVENNEFISESPLGYESTQSISATESLPVLIEKFIAGFQCESSEVKVPVSGFFGYSTYDTVKHFETLSLMNQPADREIPEMSFRFYRYIVAINHHTNRILLIEHIPAGEKPGLARLEEQLLSRTFSFYPFKASETEHSALTNEQYMQLVSKAKEHCHRGDVFQLVISRGFSRSFTGDEFSIYRTLRSINPSPYMFYFDFGSFRLLGSSPEAQIKVMDGKAFINPIAGTFRRTGNDARDKELAGELAKDPKENSEHVMLVDLARNDLSRNADKVKLNYFREIHFYSHVLHMVSEVQGTLRPEARPMQVFADTFPAGTLTGAPKIKAMQLINQYEPMGRGFYGGCIGNIGLDGKINMAITIRSVLSKDGLLHYQAGAGIVADSSELSELNEVNNKLGAVRQAIEEASQLN